MSELKSALVNQVIRHTTSPTGRKTMKQSQKSRSDSGQSRHTVSLIILWNRNLIIS
jgi:hypothetical protein